MAELIKPGLIHIDFLTQVSGNEYKIEGYYNSELTAEERGIFLRTNAGKYSLNSVVRPDLQSELSTNAVNGFEALIKIQENDQIIFTRDEDINHETEIPVHTGYFTNISPLLFAYRHDTKTNLLFRKKRTKITIKQANIMRKLTYEFIFWLRLLFYWRIDNVKVAIKGIIHSTEKRSVKKIVFEAAKPLLIIAESIAMIPRAYILRSFYFYTQAKKKRPIWIISDRGMAAGDNGEALYEYIVKLQKKPDADIFFVLSKKSKDYSRLEKLAGDKLLDQDSLRYKLLFLLADKVISSHADIEVTNPFLRQRYHFQDLMKFQFVFLQHGIIRHDHSGWLNRYQKNAALFVTSAQKEYDSILNYGYGYTKDQIALTGLPRYDKLTSRPKGKIILAPTYRRELARLPTNKNGARPYDAEFKRSAYFYVYNRVMNDERLNKALAKQNMELELYLHPNLHAQANDFRETKTAKVKSYPYNYTEAFRDGNILISDFSSVTFDFAYLKKPIIYYQFDRDTFFEHSLSEKAEFFEDERDGFGPVITNHEKLIDELCELIVKNDMDEKYKKRVDTFFYKIDTNNAKRVYESIIAMSNAV